MELQFKIANDYISEVGLKIAPVADSVNHLYAAFEFDEAWDGTVKTAIFGGAGKAYNVILKNDNKCVIPWEVLTGPCFTVSAFGIVGTERITSTEIKIPLAPSGYKNGQTPSEPSDSAYTQLLQMLSWLITNKAALTKFAEGSTDVPDMINVATEDSSITLTQALDGKADTSALGSYYTKDEIDYTVNTLQDGISEKIAKMQLINNPLAPSVSKTAQQVLTDSVYTNSQFSSVSQKATEALEGLEDKADIPAITTPTGTSVTLSDNTEARFGEVTSLTLSLPSDTSGDYISSVAFTSGTTATSLSYPDAITMIGTDCIDGVFAPVANKRYTVIVTYDGAGLVGTVGGYEI